MLKKKKDIINQLKKRKGYIMVYSVEVYFNSNKKLSKSVIEKYNITCYSNEYKFKFSKTFKIELDYYSSSIVSDLKVILSERFFKMNICIDLTNTKINFTINKLIEINEFHSKTLSKKVNALWNRSRTQFIPILRALYQKDDLFLSECNECLENEINIFNDEHILFYASKYLNEYATDKDLKTIILFLEKTE